MKEKNSLTKDGYHMDLENTMYLVEKAKPKMIVVGKSLFLFSEPVAELAEVCRQYNTRIMYDAAHVLGLIAGKRFQRPVKEEVNRFRAKYRKVNYSYDSLKGKRAVAVKSKQLKN